MPHGLPVSRIAGLDFPRPPEIAEPDCRRPSRSPFSSMASARIAAWIGASAPCFSIRSRADSQRNCHTKPPIK